MVVFVLTQRRPASAGQRRTAPGTLSAPPTAHGAITHEAPSLTCTPAARYPPAQPGAVRQAAHAAARAAQPRSAFEPSSLLLSMDVPLPKSPLPVSSVRAERNAGHVELLTNCVAYLAAQKRFMYDAAKSTLFSDLVRSVPFELKKHLTHSPEMITAGVLFKSHKLAIPSRQQSVMASGLRGTNTDVPDMAAPDNLGVSEMTGTSSGGHFAFFTGTEYPESGFTPPASRGRKGSGLGATRPGQLDDSFRNSAGGSAIEVTHAELHTLSTPQWGSLRNLTTGRGDTDMSKVQAYQQSQMLQRLSHLRGKEAQCRGVMTRDALRATAVLLHAWQDACREAIVAEEATAFQASVVGPSNAADLRMELFARRSRRAVGAERVKAVIGVQEAALETEVAAMIAAEHAEGREALRRIARVAERMEATVTAATRQRHESALREQLTHRRNAPRAYFPDDQFL